MPVLIDTHILIWALSSPDKLRSGIKDLLNNNEVLVSSASFWEIQIKRQLGKLTFDIDLGHLVRDGIVSPLSISYEHSLAVYDLPAIHKDPFDRMLIAQSKTEGIPLVTSDKNIQRYDLVFIPA
jgi:PIN domain nuclease of toxin-antitoxin system